MCASITSFCPDGGDDIYGIIIANWDGEDYSFDIESLNDIKYLSNLAEFAPSAMLKENIDLNPLLQCEKLASISIYRNDISYFICCSISKKRNYRKPLEFINCANAF